MRKTPLMAAIMAAALAVAAPSSAQDLDDYDEAPQFDQPALLIKPSQALRIAMGVAPQAKPLGVQLRGPLYIVKLKQGNRVIKVRVDAGTGAIQ